MRKLSIITKMFFVAFFAGQASLMLCMIFDSSSIYLTNEMLKKKDSCLKYNKKKTIAKSTFKGPSPLKVFVLKPLEKFKKYLEFKNQYITETEPESLEAKTALKLFMKAGVSALEEEVLEYNPLDIIKSSHAVLALYKKENLHAIHSINRGGLFGLLSEEADKLKKKGESTSFVPKQIKKLINHEYRDPQDTLCEGQENILKASVVKAIKENVRQFGYAATRAHIIKREHSEELNEKNIIKNGTVRQWDDLIEEDTISDTPTKIKDWMDMPAQLVLEISQNGFVTENND